MANNEKSFTTKQITLLVVTIGTLVFGGTNYYHVRAVPPSTVTMEVLLNKLMAMHEQISKTQEEFHAFNIAYNREILHLHERLVKIETIIRDK